MKVYKVYWLFNNEKVYLKNRGGSDIYASSRGAKCAITNSENMLKYCKNKTKAPYYIEEYECELTKEIQA